MAFRNLLVNVGLVVGRVAAKYDPSGVAEHVLDFYRNQRDKQQLRLELEALMRADFAQFRAELREAMGDARLPAGDDLRARVEAFLCQFQASARQAARQFGDPSATTVPATLAIDSADSLAAFLPQRPPRFKVGDTVPGLPSWRLVEPLGAGGFGEAWKATHPYEGEAAFKFFTDPSARQRFTEAEAGALHEIHRRAPAAGVVKLLSAEPRQDPPWLRLEYCAGGDLSRLPDEWKHLSPPERVARVRVLIRSLAATVGHFHQLGVVHRDLKPSNVLRRADGSLAVADFGISKILPAGGVADTPRNASQQTVVAYTANYASPQQKRRLPADRRDDIYSLAVLWYQLLRADLALERPSGESWKAELAKLGVTAADVALLNRCWDDEPDIRPAGGGELVELLDSEEKERARRKNARVRRPTAPMPIVVGCLLLATVVIAGIVAYSGNKPNAAQGEQPAVPANPNVARVEPLPANPKAGDVYTMRFGNPAVDMVFCWIPPGPFTMGGNGKSNKPPQQVTITKGFWIGRTEVTQAQWRAIMVGNPSRYLGDDRPVEQVSWDDCQDFCRKVGEFTRRSIRLPTEEQWEYACRAGTTSEYCNGDGAAALEVVGWYYGNSKETQVVGKLEANTWGLHDVHGNVSEWCETLSGFIGRFEQIEPNGRSNSLTRYCCGGSWSSRPEECLAAYRRLSVQNSRNSNLGLRVCFHPDG